jgi:hypothetical protein
VEGKSAYEQRIPAIRNPAPSAFNEGTLVPDEIVGQTLLDLRQRFGAVSSEPQTISGHWEQGGQVHLDDLIRVFVDVADEAGNS